MLPVMVVPRIPPLLMVLTPRAPIPALSPPPPRAEATVGDKASAIASAPAPARSLCCIDMLDSFIGLFRNSRVLIKPLCYFQLLATTAVPAREAMLIDRSEEHTSELQSRFGISYAVFCLKKKKKINSTTQLTSSAPLPHTRAHSPRH